jgi:hypothetical protein
MNTRNQVLIHQPSRRNPSTAIVTQLRKNQPGFWKFKNSFAPIIIKPFCTGEAGLAFFFNFPKISPLFFLFLKPSMLY